MIDREKVIKGFTFCSEHGLLNGEDCHGHYAYTDNLKDIIKVNDYSKQCPYNGCKTGCIKTLAKDALALLKEQEAKVMNVQFAEMTFKNGNSMFLNTEYITSYGYLKDRDETAVSVLSEAKEIYFPGNQTAEIRSAFNRINEDRR